MGPWLWFKDFNMIMDSKEKSGGRVGSNSSANYLRSLMFELGTVDLGFAGAK